MKNSFVFIVSLILLNCTFAERTKNLKVVNEQENTVHLADIFYQDLVNKNAILATIENIDSMNVINDEFGYFENQILKRQLLDSTALENAYYTPPLNIDWKVSDSIAELVRNKMNEKHKIKLYFTRPYKINENEFFIFQSTVHESSSLIAVVFFIKKKGRQWKIERIEELESIKYK